MNLSQLQDLFVRAGCAKLYAKPLAENDNSKNQVYFAGAVEALNVFPSEKVFAENTKKGPSFKARLKFGWLLENGAIAPAPGAQLILYSQYPEVRFSGFLEGCKAAPSELMADRKRALKFPPVLRRQLPGRVLFLGVTRDRRTLGYLAAGDSQLVAEFRARTFPQAFVVFREVPLAVPEADTVSRTKLLTELGRIHRLGWIDSKQLDQNRNLAPCNASQCGGFTLEAELGIPKNSKVEPDFLGWEVKQFGVSKFDRIDSAKPITLLTPEPDGGFYTENDVEAFVRRFGYADKKGRADRMNFGGRHKVGTLCIPTRLTMRLIGFDISTGKITDAGGKVALFGKEGELAASWSFQKLFEHWSQKHTKAVYVPSKCKTGPKRQYAYGDKVRLAQGTDSLKLMKAFASGIMYYDPGIKVENLSAERPSAKKRSQFRVASKNISALYDITEIVEVY